MFCLNEVNRYINILGPEEKGNYRLKSCEIHLDCLFSSQKKEILVSKIEEGFSLKTDTNIARIANAVQCQSLLIGRSQRLS